ncbi:helix-turn-helix domain-containing protein [Leptospira bandrabouensis]|uniref:helix-turn-helix domain-containing protein n=1 Tax=Leptospira bandrabouensis TaxID=2484903 RepID=UPI001090AC94|nr:helix-turn-helix domain-containing protein [Leptospira bandrabouensis]TGN08608.1 helix-turn-helix domain-containing protein [Leptospira bandrabouensis]
MRTGLWIPVEIEVLPLNLTEKVLLSEVVSLDRAGECFASNAHFAQILGVRADSISRIISKLKKMGYLKQKSFDGRRRVLIPLNIAFEQTQIVGKNQALQSKQKMVTSKSRVGESAEAAIAISQPPINIVQLKNNVQKSWDEFLEWSNGRVTPTTWDLISKVTKPEELKGQAFQIWEKWQFSDRIHNNPC